MAQMKSSARPSIAATPRCRRVRGRTGRPPTPQSASARRARRVCASSDLEGLGATRLARGRVHVHLPVSDQPPKHGSRFLAAGVFAVLAAALYTPGGYYMEQFLYRRRMAS